MATTLFVKLPEAADRTVVESTYAHCHDDAFGET
jgi:hypothetical protein